MKTPHKIKFEIFGIQKQITIEADTFQEAVQIMIETLSERIVILPDDAKREEKPAEVKKLTFFQRITEKLNTPVAPVDKDICSEPYA